MKTYLKLLPTMSQTEKEALERARVVGRELFTGAPHWPKLLAAKASAAVRGGAGLPRRPVRELCRHAR